VRGGGGGGGRGGGFEEEGMDEYDSEEDEVEGSEESELEVPL
jgi:hypothetical protein